MMPSSVNRLTCSSVSPARLATSPPLSPMAGPAYRSTSTAGSPYGVAAQFHVLRARRGLDHDEAGLRVATDLRDHLDGGKVVRRRGVEPDHHAVAEEPLV